MAEPLSSLRGRGQQAIAAGAWGPAIETLMAGAQQTQAPDAEYVALLVPLAEAFEKRGDPRSALTVEWYLSRANGARLERVLATLGPKLPPVDRARSLANLGDFSGAAREMEQHGSLVAAAIYRERAQDFEGAIGLWSRVAQTRGGRSPAPDAYQAALVQYNISVCAKRLSKMDGKWAETSRNARVACVRLLEEAADHFEATGQSERAFDCFQVLVEVGRGSSTFEDVLEGYVNCIRILREDHLKYFALQHFEEAINASIANQELTAAATLAREAADYARAIGQSGGYVQYTVKQGELWLAAAEALTTRGASPEIRENSVLAAIGAFGDVGQFGTVGSLYRKLAELPLPAKRTSHYERAATRYATEANSPLELPKSPARPPNESPEVWHVDLLEWEQAGSASEACADVLLDGRWPDILRRKAMIARLTAFAFEGAQTLDSNVALRLANQLSQLQLYNVLSPLEHLYDIGNGAMKSAVLVGMKTLFFKRTFTTVQKALREPNGALTRDAAAVIEGLFFQHAQGPLTRIARESSVQEVRTAALRALARVDTTEAAEFLVGILDHGSQADCEAATTALKEARGPKFLDVARVALGFSTPQTAQRLRDILRRRGAIK